MREIGIDISNRKPNKIDLEMQLHADRGITLNCQGECPSLIGTVEDWDVDDPAGQPLEKVGRSATTSNSACANWSTFAQTRSAPTPVTCGSRWGVFRGFESRRSRY
jgi:protein-tyrosine-phosphatase